MDKKWPFGFFVYSSLGEKEDGAPAEEAANTVETVEPVEAEPEAVKVVWAETPAAVVAEGNETLIEDDELPEEEAAEEEAEAEAANDDFDEDEDLPELEEELEIALEEAHQQEVKKQRLIKGITAGVAILGAVGLATGLSIRAHFKKK